MEKMSRNQEHNITNPYQTNTKKVLCLCSAGMLRSPTAANVIYEEYGYNTRAAGLDESHALIPVTEALLYWADEVVVMDYVQQNTVRALYEEMNPLKAKYMSDLVLNIDVPDAYSWDHPKLRERIRDNYIRIKEGTAG